MRISYLTECPECSKAGQKSHLSYETDNGKIVCDGETVHEFSEMPTERTEVATEEKVELTRDFAQEQNVTEPGMTAEEIAALDQAMSHDPRPRDFGSQVAEAEDTAQEPAGAEIVAPSEAGAQETANCGMPAMVGAIVEGFASSQPSDSPRLGLGEIVVLPDGSALACVKIDEKWVSAMQAEGENQTPPKNAAEYLQDIIDQGLLSWHMATPAAL